MTIKQEILEGIITEDGDVKLEDGRLFPIERRGIDDEGYPEVLIDAKSVGGSGFMKRQSIKPYIGMRCIFVLKKGATSGFSFTIVE